MASDFGKSKLTSGALGIFCQQTALMLSSGMTVRDGLTMLAEETADASEKKLYEDLAVGIDETGSLADAMRREKKWPTYLAEMVAVGESTGRLEEVMERMERYYERESRLRGVAVSAVAYPLSLAAMLFVIVLIVLWKVMPVFESVLNDMGMGMSGTGGKLMRFGEILGWAVLALMGLVLIISLVGFVFVKCGKQEKVLKVISRVFKPVDRLMKTISTSRVAEVLSMAIAGGFTADAAIRMAPLVSADEQTKNVVEDMTAKIDGGEPFTEVITKSGIFSDIHSRMIRLGAAAGKEDAVLGKMADVYEEEAEDGISRLVAVIEPTMVAVLCVIIGLILLSVMLPMAGILTGMI